MAKSNIRSKFVQELFESKKEAEDVLKETTKETLKNLVSEKVGENLKKMISEADSDDYDEEDVDDDTDDTGVDSTASTDSDSSDDDTDTDSSDSDDEPDELPDPDDSDDDSDTDDYGSDDDTDTDDDSDDDTDYDDSDDDTDYSDDDTSDYGEDSDDTDDDDTDDSDDDYDDLKDEDGEINLTGMSPQDAVKILKVMDPDKDGIRVVKNDNGTITINDENNDSEYVIDLNGSSDDTDDSPADDEGENTYDLSFDDNGTDECGPVESVGYTDNYQSKTAMTTLPNKEVANPRSTRKADYGVPEGDGKPWAPRGDNSPYNKKVANESDDYGLTEDDDLNEDGGVSVDFSGEPGTNEATNVGGFAAQNSTAKSHVPNSNGRRARNMSKGGEYYGTEVPRYASQNESINDIKRKANAIYEEYKQLKGLATTFQQRLSEAAVVNASLGHIVKLMMENTTTRDEKKDIISRYNKVSTLEEGKQLYSTISEELKSVKRMNNVQGVVNSQLQESRSDMKPSLVETQLYKSPEMNEELHGMLDLMKRIDKVR